MSISSSLSNALTGLTAASRAAEVVSNNVANAMTEGYGRKEINLSARTVDGSGAGVRVDGITRVVDQAILRDRRLADASVGDSATRSAFLERVGEVIGAPDDSASLTGRIAAFEAAIIEAASRPDLSARLQAVVDTATGVTDTLNEISDEIQAERLRADGAISRQVSDLNTALRQVAELNGAIVRLESGNRDASALYDERQQAIDRITGIVPVREIPRQRGAIALITTGGAVLIDGSPVTISFSPVNLITPDMTLASGALSGIEINGNPVRTDGPYSPIGGGSLAASFAVRDGLAVTAQDRIDAVARDIAERFQMAGLDPTMAPGDPGLFTDSGTAFSPANVSGFAGRIEVNATVDPSTGGELSRIRDGLGATSLGPAGDATLLNAMSAALTGVRVPATSIITSASRSASGLAAELQSLFGRDAVASEANLGFATARQESLRTLERQSGVDTDQEMQKLLLIEQAYAANARVIQAVDAMIGALLEI